MPTKPISADKTEPLSEDALRQRAYYLWEADGRPDGRNEHYWHLANAEATQQLVERTADRVARATKGKNPAEPPPAVKAKLKAKPKATEPKAAKKASSKPRAAVRTAG